MVTENAIPVAFIWYISELTITKAKNNILYIIKKDEFKEIITLKNGIVQGLKEIINEKIRPKPKLFFIKGKLIGFNLFITAKIPKEITISIIDKPLSDSFIFCNILIILNFS